jgi:phosphoribosylformylglycinamidine synthase subunit PurS
VNGVRQGKYFEIELAETDKAKAQSALRSMCDKLIANTVIENYEIELA